MTDLRKAAEMALEALENADYIIDMADAHYSIEPDDREKLITALRQALAQSEQEPFGYVIGMGGDKYSFSTKPPEGGVFGTLTRVYTAPPSTSGYAKKIESLIKERDELRQALAQGEQEHKPWCDYLNIMLTSLPPQKAKCNCKQAQSEQKPFNPNPYARTLPKPMGSLEQPEQEPVAYVGEVSEGAELMLDKPNGWEAIPLYTAPPKRQWVGLTDEELAESLDINLGEYDLCLEIEAKLKEKNT